LHFDSCPFYDPKLCLGKKAPDVEFYRIKTQFPDLVGVLIYCSLINSVCERAYNLPPCLSLRCQVLQLGSCTRN